jgi:hypothetical protein
MEIFAFSKANIDFVQRPTLKESLMRIGSVPFWVVFDRICYHIHETPEYILYRNLPMPIRYRSVIDEYLHINPRKKSLLSMSSYTHADLSGMSEKLNLPVGTKTFMYAQIKEEIVKNEEVVKKLIQGLSVEG